MELLKSAILADLQNFQKPTDPFRPPPNFDYYFQIITHNRMTATSLQKIVDWLDQDNERFPGVSFGYISYIKLFIKKFEAAKRFEEYGRANLCVVCYANIGDSNPRQLCGKRSCPYQT